MIALLLVCSLLQEPVKTDAECMKCHVDVTKQWRSSVHAKHETSCISCHKTDVVDPTQPAGKQHSKRKPFVSGKKNTSPAMCATCHGKETEEFKKGPHWDEDVDANAKWTAKKRQGCLSCHEPHGTAAAERKAIFAERCTHCHKENSSQQKRMISYMAVADPFDAELAALKKFLEHPLPGIPYAKAENVLNTAEDKHEELRKVQHNCEFKALEKEIEPLFPKVKTAAAQLKAEYDDATRRRRNYFFGFLALMVVNLFLLRAWCVKKYGGHKA